MARPVGQPASLVPEFDVRDLDTSLRFYVGVIGFAVIVERASERFAYLGVDGAELMLQDASGRGRRFRTAPLPRYQSSDRSAGRGRDPRSGARRRLSY